MTCLLRSSIALRRLAVRLATIDAAHTLLRSAGAKPPAPDPEAKRAHHRLMLDALATLAAVSFVLAVVARLV
jgi:hypothetical protein